MKTSIAYGSTGVANNLLPTRASAGDGTGTLTAATAYDVTYTLAYNAASQIVSRTVSNDAYVYTKASASTSYASDGLNRLTSIGAAATTYDARGNMTSDGSRTFGYSSENLVTNYEGIAIAYDPLTRFRTGGGITLVFDPEPGANYELVTEYSGGVTASRNIFGPGTDEPAVILDRFGNRTWLLPDERGSIVAGTVADGSVQHVNQYDEYGVEASGAYYRFSFTGQVTLTQDTVSMRNRLYDPATGRFFQTDPIGYDDQANLYAYVGDDPVNKTDPSGMCGYRYEDGSCRVKVDSGTGEAGAAAGKALEVRLNAYDKAVNATSDNASIPVRDSKGNQTGTVTGKELKAIWNHTGFRITAHVRDNGGAGGGTSGSWHRNGEFRNGTSKLTPQVVQDYAARGVRAGGTSDNGRDALIFHELGHNTNIGRALQQMYPAHRGPFGPQDWARERGTSSAARAMLNSVGGAYECGVTGCD